MLVKGNVLETNHFLVFPLFPPIFFLIWSFVNSQPFHTSLIFAHFPHEAIQLQLMLMLRHWAVEHAQKKALSALVHIHELTDPHNWLFFF